MLVGLDSLSAAGPRGFDSLRAEGENPTPPTYLGEYPIVSYHSFT